MAERRRILFKEYMKVETGICCWWWCWNVLADVHKFICGCAYCFHSCVSAANHSTVVVARAVCRGVFHVQWFIYSVKLNSPLTFTIAFFVGVLLSSNSLVIMSQRVKILWKVGGYSWIATNKEILTENNNAVHVFPSPSLQLYWLYTRVVLLKV